MLCSFLNRPLLLCGCGHRCRYRAARPKDLEIVRELLRRAALPRQKRPAKLRLKGGFCCGVVSAAVAIIGVAAVTPATAAAVVDVPTAATVVDILFSTVATAAVATASFFVACATTA